MNDVFMNGRRVAHHPMHDASAYDIPAETGRNDLG
jgi:hypothetical protein